MRTESFQAELRSGHKEHAVQVPFDPGVRWALTAQRLWPRRRGYPVHATLDGVAFDSAIVTRSLRFWLLIPAEIAGSGAVSVGQRCSITVAPRQAFKPAGNLLSNSEPPPEGERFETLLAHKHLVIERIVSSATVDQTEQVQDQDEWVAILRGEATLDFAGETVTLHSGDYLFLPAGTPHTVQRVSAGALWLAVHLH